MIFYRKQKKSSIYQSYGKLYLQFSVSESQSASLNVDTDPRQPCLCIDARDLIVDVAILSFVFILYAQEDPIRQG